MLLRLFSTHSSFLHFVTNIILYLTPGTSHFLDDPGNTPLGSSSSRNEIVTMADFLVFYEMDGRTDRRTDGRAKRRTDGRTRMDAYLYKREDACDEYKLLLGPLLVSIVGATGRGAARIIFHLLIRLSGQKPQNWMLWTMNSK